VLRLEVCAFATDLVPPPPHLRKGEDEPSLRDATTAPSSFLASSRQAISQHLDVLERAGLIKSERRGRCKFHEIDTTPLERIVDRWLHNIKEDVCASR
jgi:DNA-binding transcriptional ArsR family regulator